jgi:RNA polymerase sigma-70 factor (ECF subfamily)
VVSAVIPNGPISAHEQPRDELTEWALRAREGDVIAQAAFVRTSQADVWRVCAALCSPDEADDLTQEVYLRAFRALPDFMARSSARTWLLSIARRTCVDQIRGHQRRRRLDSVLRRVRDTVEPDHSGNTVTHDLLQQLAQDRRSAFVLTATVEEVPIGTIRSRVARAREDLAAAFRHADVM